MKPVETADPLPLLKGFVSLRRLVGAYPASHPMITQKIRELEEIVRHHLATSAPLQLNIVHDEVHLNGESFGREHHGNAQILRELNDLGVQSIHIHEGVEPNELLAMGEFLWQLRDAPQGGTIEAQLAKRNIRHIDLAKLVPLDTRWRTQQWPDAPTGPLDPSYAEALVLAEQTFDTVASGRSLDLVTVRDLMQLLIHRVARSSAALGQILAVKQYENLTYCHSVNVAMLSMLLGKQLRFDEAMTAALVEAALLHDIGKTRIPLDLVKKPGTLDKREKRLMDSHTILGAEILSEIDGLRPLTPVVALEHHRGVKGNGYPNLGDGVVPHWMSQIVSVADVYEALTGARSYQLPKFPEQACLILARFAGEKLNTALVKTFVNAITFFPLGSLVRTDRDERGIVVRTNSADPLHPVIAILDEDLEAVRGEIDTSTRDGAGAYERHVVETVRLEGRELDLTRFLAAEPEAA